MIITTKKADNSHRICSPAELVTLYDHICYHYPHEDWQVSLERVQAQSKHSIILKDDMLTGVTFTIHYVREMTKREFIIYPKALDTHTLSVPWIHYSSVARSRPGSITEFDTLVDLFRAIISKTPVVV